MTQYKQYNDLYENVRCSLYDEGDTEDLMKQIQEYAQQIASLAWDAGCKFGDDNCETGGNSKLRTKEQFLNSIFNNQQETK